MPVEADAEAVAAAAAAAAAAISAQRRHIIYPEYKPEDDFALWLSGYVARIQSAYGFKLDEKEKLDEEVVRSIAGKLSVGSALDAYNRLSYDEKIDYDTLIARLTEEFTDPRAKKKFNALMHYNLRKKGQSLKDSCRTSRRIWAVTRTYNQRSWTRLVKLCPTRSAKPKACGGSSRVFATKKANPMKNLSIILNIICKT